MIIQGPDILPSELVGDLHQIRGKTVMTKKDFRKRYEGALGKDRWRSSCAFRGRPKSTPKEIAEIRKAPFDVIDDLFRRPR